MPVVNQRLLDVNQASKYLGVTPESLYQMVHRRTVPYVKMGKALRFDLERLNEFIELNAVNVIDYRKYSTNSK